MICSNKLTDAPNVVCLFLVKAQDILGHIGKTGWVTGKLFHNKKFPEIILSLLFRITTHAKQGAHFSVNTE